MPPSVVVDELRDYLARRFGGGFAITHPLQPFSRRYYEPGSGLWSYSASMLDAARTQAGHRHKATDTQAQQRFTVPFEPVGEERERRVELARLTAFFGNPTRAFLRDHLGIRLEVDEIALAEDEPFKLDGLQQWALKSEMYGLDADEEIKRLVTSRGRLPAGGPGEVVYEDMQADVREFQRALNRYEEALSADPKDIDVDVEGYRLTGAVDNVAVVDAGKRHELLRWRIGRIRPQDRFGAWLELLAWVAQEEVGAEAHLVCLAPGEVQRTRFEAPDAEEAREHLGLWLDAWWRGTERLLPFAPGASMEYANRFMKSQDRDHAWNDACRAWSGDYAYDGLLNDYVSLAYDGEYPFDEDGFADLAETLLLPLLDAERKLVI